MDKPKNISELMSWIGSQKSAKKAEASRANGKLGGCPINPNSRRQKKLKKNT